MKKLGVPYFLNLLAFAIMMAHIMIPHDHHHPEEIPHYNHQHDASHSEGAEHHHSHPVHPEHVFTKAGRLHVTVDSQNHFLQHVTEASLIVGDIYNLPLNIKYDPPPDILTFRFFAFSGTIFRGPPSLSLS